MPEGGNKNYNKFRKPYNPQILQRKENIDQKVPPHFLNYLYGEDDDEEEGNRDINFLQKQESEVYLNVEDYQNSSINQFSNDYICSNLDRDGQL